MKLAVKNLGRVKEAEIDIRPLTVFIGPNNTNKSWVAYAYWALQGRRSLLPTVEFDLSPSLRPLAEKLAAEIASSKTKYEVSVSWETVQELLSPSEVEKTSLTGKQIRQVTGHWASETDGTQVSGTVESPGTAGLFSSFDFRFDPEAKIISSFVDRGDAGKVLESSRRNLTNETLIPEMSKFIWERLDVLGFKQAMNCIVLPPERISEAAILTFRPMTNPLDIPDAMQGPFVLQWLQENLRQWVETSALQKVVRDRMKPSDFSKIYHPWFWVVEYTLREHMANLIDGNPVDDIQRGWAEAFFAPEGSSELRLPLWASASFVKSAVPLLAFLESNRSAPGDVIVIDEPEMNAHPEAQLKITEFLAILVNRGFKILFTTHSPYIVDHLVNLTQGFQVPKSRRGEAAKLLKLGSEDAFLDSDKLAVYSFEEHGKSKHVRVSSIFDRANVSIDWSTFSRASDYTSNVYTDLRLMMEAKRVRASKHKPK